MSTITECLPAETLTYTVDTPSVIMPSVVEITGAIAAPVIFNNINYLMVPTSMAVSGAIASEFLKDLLAANLAVSASILDHLNAYDLVQITGKITASTISTVKELATASLTMTITPITSGIVTLVNAGNLNLSASILGGVTLKDLLTAPLSINGTIAANFKELVAATNLAITAEVMPGATLYDTITAGMAIAAAIVTSQRTTGDLLNVPLNIVAAAFGINNAIDLIEDDARIAVAPLDDYGIAAWTAATDTFAMSRYTFGQHVAALGVLDGTLLLFGNDGAYARAGTDDDGVPFDAEIVTGMQDFDDDSYKRADKAYLAFKGTAPILDVGETRTGAEVTYSYMPEALPGNVTAVTNARYVYGRGIESRSLRHTIRSNEHAPFSLRGFQIEYIKTSRRR